MRDRQTDRDRQTETVRQTETQREMGGGWVVVVGVGGGGGALAILFRCRDTREGSQKDQSIRMCPQPEKSYN